MRHTITTAKGSYTGTLADVCVWQARMQGTWADIDGVSVDHIEFRAASESELDATTASVARTLIAGLEYSSALAALYDDEPLDAEGRAIIADARAGDLAAQAEVLGWVTDVIAAEV